MGDDKCECQHSRTQQTKMDWMGEFNSDDHYTTVVKNPLEKME